MNKLIKTMVMSFMLLSATAVMAVPMPDFIVYGKSGDAKSVSAYLFDKKLSDATFNGGYFRLAIPMDSAHRYASGASIELWVNGAPTGDVELIKGMGEVVRHDLVTQ